MVQTFLHLSITIISEVKVFFINLCAGSEKIFQLHLNDKNLPLVK